MRCPHCYSLNARRSLRRHWERPITWLLPIRPYRCRSCSSRFWLRDGPVLSVTRVAALTGAAALTAVFAIRSLGLLQPAEDVSAEPPPAVGSLAQVPASPQGPAAAPPAATKAAAETRPVELSATPPPKPSTPAAGTTRKVAPQPLSPAPAVPPPPGPSAAPPRDALPPIPASFGATPPGAERLAASPARTLASLASRDEEGVLLIEARLSETVEDYDVFSLEDPRRIVVDVPGRWKVETPEVVEIGHYLATRLRVGKHAEQLRLVIDASMDADPQPRIESAGGRLKIRVFPLPFRPLPG